LGAQLPDQGGRVAPLAIVDDHRRHDRNSSEGVARKRMGKPPRGWEGPRGGNSRMEQAHGILPSPRWAPRMCSPLRGPSIDQPWKVRQSRSENASRKCLKSTRFPHKPSGHRPRRQQGGVEPIGS
jgi:hypothetical protein